MGTYIVYVEAKVREMYEVEAENADEAMNIWDEGVLIDSENRDAWSYDAEEEED